MEPLILLQTCGQGVALDLNQPALWTWKWLSWIGSASTWDIKREEQRIANISLDNVFIFTPLENRFRL